MSVPAVVLLLSLATIAAVVVLEQRSTASRNTQLQLAGVDRALTRLQMAPFRGMAVIGGSPEAARAQVRVDRRSIALTLADLERHGSAATVRELKAPLEANFAAIEAILPIATAPAFTSGLDPWFYPLLKAAARSNERAQRLLARAGSANAAHADRAQTQATVGSAGAILLLFGAFALVYTRVSRARLDAECLAGENARLAASSRRDARTDSLTGLRNRRAFVDDLDAELAAAGAAEATLALFDLDGFKHYNDTFGHLAGDGLLARLGAQLQAAVHGSATAYRIGGDEFCVLTSAESELTATALVSRAAESLSEAGDGFRIACSYGVAALPREASSSAAALQLADQRMYGHKTGRVSASRQSGDVLLKVLSERDCDLGEHLTGVAALAADTARELGLPHGESEAIALAAELHDVGKTAIPDAILYKPGPLDDEEWAFMRQHTVIGERILLAAPSLAPAAELVRASHEAFDGSGYPDRLRGEAIPLGARIIAVCDAFDAMVSTRAYRAAMPIETAIAELERCAGTQFDPRVVGAFCRVAPRDGSSQPPAAMQGAEPITTGVPAGISDGARIGQGAA